MSSLPAFEYTEVVICGCGPTGAVLSANLGQLGIKHIVLEKEANINTDPRGIALDEDGIRIVQGIGKYKELYTKIGEPAAWIKFIEAGKSLSARPFLQINAASIEGGTGHPLYMSHKQPVLEEHLRAATNKSLGEMKTSSTLSAIREDDKHVMVDYHDEEGNLHTIRAQFLVGADGKTGFVRKKYLEPMGVVMENSPKYRYEAVWVALNWQLTLPTPRTHPKFPLWKLGYSPEQVYDLFFPNDFSFICDPGRPAVCGRFGKLEEHLWRFEFVVKPGEDGHTMSSEYETRKIIFPFLRHKGYCYGLSHDVSWPEDCILCLRSRHYSFSARSCNKWALGRVILCGDAAHVVPPFGVQGIASGFRDAISLAWRLKIMTGTDTTPYKALLYGWYAERKQQLERSLELTIANGNYTCEPSVIKSFFRGWSLWALQLIPSIKHILELGPRSNGMLKYQWSHGMPFLPQYGGGSSFPQVFAAPLNEPAPSTPAFTDDAIFANGKRGIFQIAVLLETAMQINVAQRELAEVISRNQTIIDTAETTYIIHSHLPVLVAAQRVPHTSNDSKNIVRVIDADEYINAGLINAPSSNRRPNPLYYDPNRIRRDLGKQIRYVVVRWDRIVFAACRDTQQLQQALDLIDSCLYGQELMPGH